MGSTPSCIRQARPKPGLGLAEQELERCRSEDIASGAGATPATNGTIPDLLKDLFLNMDLDQASPAPADAITAMPWLSSDEEPRAMATPDPSPGSCAEPTANAHTRSQFRRGNGKPGTSTERRRATPQHHRARTSNPAACGNEAFGTLMAPRSTPA
ncbi:hypothetical protein Syncc8109_0075 [Synechococcus sp. WH 8109]|nr:hypothetical protein Syncc8109_0075 [Synechococcus sp. WH 8109]